MPLLLAAGLGLLVGVVATSKVSGVADDVADDVADAAGSVTGVAVIGGAAGVAAFFVMRKVCK